MTKPLIGCDVDLVCCSSDRGWRNYLVDNCTNEEFSLFVERQMLEMILPYNLGSLFPSIENPMEYWNNLDYSTFEPIKGSVEVLQKLSEEHGVVFISHIEGGSHGKSKCAWLKKHYPFLTGISYTREKFIHNNSVDWMIDDRLSHLKHFDYTKRIQFNTVYTQDEEVEVFGQANNWQEVYKIITGEDYEQFSG